MLAICTKMHAMYEYFVKIKFDMSGVSTVKYATCSYVNAIITLCIMLYHAIAYLMEASLILPFFLR